MKRVCRSRPVPPQQFQFVAVDQRRSGHPQWSAPRGFQGRDNSQPAQGGWRYAAFHQSPPSRDSYESASSQPSARYRHPVYVGDLLAGAR